MRKAQDDVMARTDAERSVGDELEATGLINSSANEPAEAGRVLLGMFKAIEFETTSRKVGDEELRLRRLVITGPWEVDPTGK
jgi:hypothetical protein